MTEQYSPIDPGRYDVSIPLEIPWRLQRAWPESELVVVTDAGHGGGSMRSALIDALEQSRSSPH